MTKSEIRALSLEELKQKIASEEDSLQRMKFAHEVSPIENPMKIKQTRKLIARLKTVLTAKLSAEPVNEE